MNKSALVSEVAKRVDVPRGEAARVVDALLELVRDRVARGHRISLTGFGTFERRRRNPRVGRNPRTGEAVKIPARNVPTFKPGAAFRQAVAAPRATKKSAARKASSKR